MWNNKLLNINGDSKELLALALNVAFKQCSHSNVALAKSWTEKSTHGLLLSWHDQFNRFPTPLTHELATPVVWQWLQSKQPTDFTLKQWEENLDHDGSNKIGWRVYVEDWGSVDKSGCMICAVKPIYLWFGK